MRQVLLVEDEAVVAEAVEDALSLAGLKVRIALTDQSAYESLELEPRSFAAVVADIDLGEGTTGFDVARRARQLNDQVAIIYITGEPGSVDRFGIEGAAVIAKPFNPDTIADQVLGALNASGRDR